MTIIIDLWYLNMCGYNLRTSILTRYGLEFLDDFFSGYLKIQAYAYINICQDIAGIESEILGTLTKEKNDRERQVR